jgi:hypothetical protein
MLFESLNRDRRFLTAILGILIKTIVSIFTTWHFWAQLKQAILFEGFLY